MWVAADADMAPPSHYVEIFKLLDGCLRDGGWMGEGTQRWPRPSHPARPDPLQPRGLSPLFADVTLALLDEPKG